MALKGDYLVSKGNLLNEMRQTSMTLEEMRFFTIYLSKIDPRDPSTAKVRFSLDEFRKIMGIKYTDRRHLDRTTDELLKKIIKIPNTELDNIPTEKKNEIQQFFDKNKNYTFLKFNLFNVCYLGQDENGEDFVELEAHPMAQPLLFDLKSHYFKYRLWNALRLKSANQFRMYEILKQYERIGYREMSIEDLRELLGIAPNEYAVWQNFKVKILDSCQAALAENTDIKFSYYRTKAGRGGKWLRIRFDIYKNEDYNDQLTLEEYFQPGELVGETITEEEPEEPPANEEKDPTLSYIEEDVRMIQDIAPDGISESEIKVINSMLYKLIPDMTTAAALDRADYFISVVQRMTVQAEKQTINDKGAYIRGIIRTDIEKKKKRGE